MAMSFKSIAVTLGLAFAGTGSFVSTASAQAIQCGGTYTVRVGDSLSLIAQRAYGDPQAFQFIYSANSGLIGPNPSVIRLGDTFSVPCLDTQTASTAPELRAERGTSRLPFPDQRQIRIVTATDWAPFLNEDQEQGGMLTEMVNLAMSKADNQTNYKIDFVNDWGSHLTPLITDMAYDFSIAWFKPNCAQINRLGGDSQFRCNNFDWTDPVYEQIFGYYTRASDPAPTSYESFSGKTICRPEGYATFMLEENDLKAPNIVLERPISPSECFAGLHEGRFDVVAIATETAVAAISELGVEDKTRFDENLSQVLTLHGVISKNHPQGQEMLGEFNSGLRKIKESGEWFQIVLRHLREHKENTQ